MSNLVIEVREANIVTKSGIGRTSGKPYRMDEQPAFVTLPNGETRRVMLSHNEGDAPLPVGRYVPLPSAYWVGDFGALSISTKARHWASEGAVSLAAKKVS